MLLNFKKIIRYLINTNSYLKQNHSNTHAIISIILVERGSKFLVHLPLMISWCATCFLLTRHGGVDEVGSLEK